MKKKIFFLKLSFKVRTVCQSLKRELVQKKQQQMSEGQDGKLIESISQLVKAETVEVDNGSTYKKLPKGLA